MAETAPGEAAPPRDGAPSTVIVVNGGSAPYPGIGQALPGDAFVIAADSGFAHAHALGLTVDELIGDFDSLAPADLALAQTTVGRIISHPVDKDATDLELALDLAVGHGPDEIIVVAGGEGDRIDHFISTVSLLSDPRYGPVRVSAWFGRSRLVVVRPGQPATLRRVIDAGTDHGTGDGLNGDFVTLDPVTDEVRGVTTSGLRFALHDDTLRRHRTRGVSNVFASSSASVSVTDGTLLVIQPVALTSATHAAVTDQEPAR